ncbi:hypothetical protein EO087_13370 [Dyella sp. M7H15-1]|nr:hypothetical protein EO087_13370 [Dyella sp. M7H15-1]
MLLADALYCSYFVIATLQRLGVDVVFEQHDSRTTDFRRGQRLGVRDHRVTWNRPARPIGMTPEQHQVFPVTLTLREVDVGGKILVTTLIDPRDVHKKSLIQVFALFFTLAIDQNILDNLLFGFNIRCLPGSDEILRTQYYLWQMP